MGSQDSAKYLAETYQELKRTLGELGLAQK